MDKKRIKLYQKFNKNLPKDFEVALQKDASEQLWNLLLQEEVETNSPALKAFVKKFFIYKHRVELEKEYAASMLSSGILRANLVLLLKQKKILHNLDELYTELCLFHIEFYQIFGISLSRTLDAIDKENELAIKKIS